MLGLSATSAKALSPDDFCIERKTATTVLTEPRPFDKNHGKPTAFSGLVPKVSIPRKGHVGLHDPTTGEVTEIRSPAGVLTWHFMDFDPKSSRLYIWGWDEIGWIEILQKGDTWVFGDSETITPKLYDPPHDIDDVQGVRRSEALGLLFHHGYNTPYLLLRLFGAPRWLQARTEG